MLALVDGVQGNLTSKTEIVRDDFREEARAYLAKVAGDVYE